MTVEEQVELVGTFVRGVVERFGYEATTTTRIEDDRLYVDVTGEDLGLLIGPRGVDPRRTPGARPHGRAAAR